MGEWRNWQTRRIQVPVSARTWGFKSPLAHTVFRNRQRSHRRTRLVVALVVTIIAVLAVLVGRLTDDARLQSAYLDEARRQSTEIAQSATSFEDIAGRLIGVQRGEFTRVMDALQQTVGNATTELAGITAAPELAAPDALMGLAAQQWAAGLTRFEEAILRAVDSPSDLEVVDDVATALHELGNGDRLYLSFAERLNLLRTELEVSVGTFPEVEFLLEGTRPAERAASLVGAARLAPGLPLLSQMAIEDVRTDPLWVESVDGELVVVATDTLLVAVVVANRGNATASPRQVSVEIVSGGSRIGEPLTALVPELAPDSSTVVELPSVVVVPGAAYELVARLELAEDEIQTDDNVRRFEFRINPATGG